MASSSKPPYNDKEPENEYEENDVPQPTTPLSLCHVVHPSKCPRKDTRRLRKRIVHLAELDSRLSYLVPNANRNILEQLHFSTQSFERLVILAL